MAKQPPRRFLGKQRRSPYSSQDDSSLKQNKNVSPLNRRLTRQETVKIDSMDTFNALDPPIFYKNSTVEMGSVHKLEKMDSCSSMRWSDWRGSTGEQSVVSSKETQAGPSPAASPAKLPRQSTIKKRWRATHQPSEISMTSIRKRKLDIEPSASQDDRPVLLTHQSTTWELRKLMENTELVKRPKFQLYPDPPQSRESSKNQQTVKTSDVGKEKPNILKRKSTTYSLRELFSPAPVHKSHSLSKPSRNDKIASSQPTSVTSASTIPLDVDEVDTGKTPGRSKTQKKVQGGTKLKRKSSTSESSIGSGVPILKKVRRSKTVTFAKQESEELNNKKTENALVSKKTTKHSSSSVQTLPVIQNSVIQGEASYGKLGDSLKRRRGKIAKVSSKRYTRSDTV